MVEHFLGDKFIAYGIEDTLLKTIMLTWLSNNIDSDGTFTLEDPASANGFRYMRNLMPGDLRKVADHLQKSISVVIDRAGLLEAFRRAQADRESVDQLKYFMNHGASRDMIADILGVTDDRIINARSRLGRPPYARGRPKLPSEADQALIVAQWMSTPHLRGAARYIAIHEGVGIHISLVSIKAVIEKFVADESVDYRQSSERLPNSSAVNGAAK